MTVRQADPYGKGSYCIVVALHGSNSFEAETLRRFRDRYVYSLPGGRAMMDLYYRVSPAVVEQLSTRSVLRGVVSSGITSFSRFVSVLPGI